MPSDAIKLAVVAEDEYQQFKARYDENSLLYRSVSEHILGRCAERKRTYPTEVRLVFSRDPVVKEWRSLIKKIEDKRAKKPSYGFDDLEDLIALTILCPYKSDAKEFIEWMKKSFDVLTLDDDAIRSDPKGHRGYHYIVHVDPDVLRSFPHYEGIKCEIQIKTILEEAFDAKSHDLTYKPGDRKVSEEIKSQFGTLSGSLGLVDEQSEFLRNLLLAEERDVELRRRGCVMLYVKDKDTMALLEKHSISIQFGESHDIGKISEKLREIASKSPSLEACKCATACALLLNDEYLKVQALKYCRILEETNKDPQMVLNVASFRWVLGKLEEAIQTAERSIKSAIEHGSPELITRAKNDFLYYVADWKSFVGNRAKGEKSWLARAVKYEQELSTDASAAAIEDTLGFYWIAFGTTREEVDRGRQLIHKAREDVPSEEYEDFYRYHEHVALRRLQEILHQDVG